MYILIDGFTEAVHPLGSTPMEAILAFCDHVQNGEKYPSGLNRGLTKLFEQHVHDGTESELFAMVNHFSEAIKEAKCGPRGPLESAFRLRKIPRRENNGNNGTGQVPD